MQFLVNGTNLKYDEDANIYDDLFSSRSTSLLSNGEYLEDDLYIDNDQVLGNIFTLEQRCMVILIKLVEDMNCPDSAVTRIIDWAKKAFNDGFNFNPFSKTYYGHLQ